MIADLWLLLVLRWQVGWNRFVRRRTLAKLALAAGALVIAVGGGGTFGFLGYGVGRLLWRFPDPALEALIPGLILTAVAILLLLTSIGSELGSLFFAGDLELLMAAPVDRKAVFISKIADGLGTTYFLMLATAGSALAAYGVALGYGPLYFLFALLALLGTPLLPAGLGSVAVMIVARVAPVRRVREVLGLTAGLLGVTCSLLGQTSRVWAQQLGIGSGEPSALLTWAHQAAALPIPSFIAGRGLASAGAGDLLGAIGGLSGFWLLTFGLFGGSVLLAGRLYEAGWVRMKSGGAAKRGRDRAEREATRPGLLGRAPVALAIALKDWRLVTRDLRNFAAFLWPILLLPMVFFNLVGGRRSANPIEAVDALVGGAFDPGPILVAGSILAVASLFVSRVASTGISLEGRSWWVLKTAPITPAELLAGKLLAALIPFAILGTVGLIVAALVQQYSLVGALYGLFGILLIGSGSLAISVGLSAPWARLDWDSPRQMSSGWGSAIALVLQAVLALVAGGLLALPVALEAVAPSWVAAAYPAAIVAAVLVTAGLGYGIFRVGVGWLPKVGEA
ncbi:MAG: hypothetical protein U0556_19575 [Dehalococcoidia bacterium]